ncbi:MAG: HigA family addiction module antitoxin [Acidiferrobacterales bacterium]|jgi:addiction module HigA family antidote
MATQLDPITPGEILRDEFMAEYGLSQNKLALDLNTPASIVNRIVNNKLRITADMALRLGKYFGTTAQFWMNLQTSYDLRVAERQTWPQIKDKVRQAQKTA